MSEEFGNDFISVTDENGNELELEHLDTIELDDEIYMAFLPANMDENDDDYGMIILKVIEEDGEELFATIESAEEIEKAYEKFMEHLFSDEE